MRHSYKKQNEYAERFTGKLYARTPKAVFAAVALSFAQRLAADDTETAMSLFFIEWETLNLNGIVPQRAPFKNVDFAVAERCLGALKKARQ